MGTCFSASKGQQNSHHYGHDHNSTSVRSESARSSMSQSSVDQQRSHAQPMPSSSSAGMGPAVGLSRLESVSPRTLKKQRDQLLNRIQSEGSSFRTSARERQEFQAAYISQHANDHNGGAESWETEVWDLDLTRQRRPELQGVAIEDLVAVRAWTTQDYKIVQDVLEADSKPTLEGLAYAKAITSGLHSLPESYTYAGPVFTGEDQSQQWVHERHKEGEVATSRRFFATSETKETAWQGKSVDWETNSLSGKQISTLSYHPEEREVLFPPGTRFRTDAVDTNSEPGKLKIAQSEV